MRLFIAHILPKDVILKYHQSVAAHLFCYKLINANLFDRVYSILPLIPIANEDLAGYDKNIYPVYSSLRTNPVLRKIAIVYENLKLIFCIPKYSAIWFYNLPVISIFLFWGLKIFKPSVSLNIILLDYTPQRKGFSGLVEKFLLFSINKSHGIIKLADSPLFTCANSVCLPGVVSSNAVLYPLIRNVEASFLISGALADNISLLSMLLNVFSRMPDMVLHITGYASDISLITKYAARYRNIIYHGVVEYDEYLHLLHDITFLLSTRDPNAPENQCNFPSKIIEGLLHNRIIISTLNYRQLGDIKYFKVPADEVKFEDALLRIVQLPQTILLEYANQGEKIQQRFNTDVWKIWMGKIEKNEK